MAIAYRIYANDGQGGPVDYAHPIATTTSTSYSPGPVPPGSDMTYAVRAYDDVLGIEESNLSVKVRLRTDAHGNDVGANPGPLVGPSARRIAGRRLALAWLCPPRRALNNPTGFRIYAAPLMVGEPDQLVATVDYEAGRSVYRLTLADAGYRSVTIRPFNAAGERMTEPVLTLSGLPSTASLSPADLIEAHPG